MQHEKELCTFSVKFQGHALKAYSDADFSTDIVNSRSTSVAIITFNGEQISWFAR